MQACMAVGGRESRGSSRVGTALPGRPRGQIPASIVRAPGRPCAARKAVPHHVELGALWMQAGPRLADQWERSVVDDIFSSALKKQTGVSLKYMCARAGGTARMPAG